MKQVYLADRVPIDLQRLIVTRMLIQASSGAGKSWAIRRLLEQSHGAVQHIVIDPEGEFFTLREKYDYVLAAKQGGDTAVDPRTAGLLAERLLELKVSAILDLYELKIDQRVEFVRRFLEALIDAPKKLWHPALIVVDEAHAFCPEKEKSESSSAVKDLCTRGRKRGFAAILATQRLAKLAKDAAAECGNKLIGRTNLDIDLERACKELGLKGRESDQVIKRLGDGDFFAYGPALWDEVKKVHVGPVFTTHPKVGVQLTAEAPPPTERIRALLPKLSDLPAEQARKEKTVADLQTEIRSLKGQLAARPKDTVEKTVTKRVEVPVLKDSQIGRLEKIAASYAAHSGKLIAAIEKTHERVVYSVGLIAEIIGDVRKKNEKINADMEHRQDAVPYLLYPAGHRYQPVAFDGNIKVVHHPDNAPSAYAMGLLKTLCERQPMQLTPNQLATLSGRSSRSSAFMPAVRELLKFGLAQDGAGGLEITAFGLQTLGKDAVAPCTTREDIIRTWLRVLPATERVLFDIVVKKGGGKSARTNWHGAPARAAPRAHGSRLCASS